MYLHDAYDDILQRKADEAPAGIAPLNYTWTAPGYDPSKFAQEMPAGTVAPEQIVITAKKIPPTPAPIQIPLLKFTTMPVANPWDQITARRAAMPVQTTRANYWPWIIGGLAAVAALLMLSGGEKKTAPARPSPRPRAAPVRRVSYARRSRR